MNKITYIASLLLVTLFLLINPAYAGGPEQHQKAWLFYFGGFGGYFNADYEYGGDIIPPSSGQEIGTVLTQPGASGGLQLGFQYHFQSPYFLGLIFSGAITAGKGRVVVVDYINPAVGFTNLNYQFRVNGHADMAAVFGLDVTPQTHLYLKAGASYTTLTESFFNTAQFFFLNPSSAFQSLERQSLWGWIVGVGLTYDISRWWNTFVEYDRYDYGTNDLSPVNEIHPGTLARLTHHIRVTSSAVHIGFNLKLMDNYYVPVLRKVINNAWLFYLGTFAGYNYATYEHGGTYFSNIGNTTIGFTGVQQGFSGGGQFGIQYHFQSPYFIGMSTSIADNADKARGVVNIPITADGSAPDLTFQFRTAYNLDITSIFGLDITPQTHLYAKFGAAYTRLLETLEGFTAGTAASPTTILNLHQDQYFWGFALGVGLAQDLSRFWSVFAEYNRYDFGNNNLPSLNNIFGGGGTDRLTQHLRLTTSTVRLGLNLKFNGKTFIPRRVYGLNRNTWLFYLGGFVGYYSATFQYKANYFTNLPSNQTILQTAFQRGASGGGQLGFQYHFQKPYFLGLNISASTNANKARLGIVEIGTPVNRGTTEHQFRINSNVDIFALVGLDILVKTHLYAKLGASCGAFTNTIVGTSVIVVFPGAVFSHLQRISLWGWAAGLGLTQDLTRHVNMFIEYNRYDFGRRELNSFDTLFGFADHLVQSVRPAAYTVRLGFNVQFRT